VTATQEVALQKASATEDRLQAFSDLKDFDWKHLPPTVMARVLMKKPYRGKSGEPDYYLSPEQALVFAMRSFELGLSPLSSKVWFDRDRWTTNVTLEGKLRLARERGNVGPPQFEDLEREWRKGVSPIGGFSKEPGIKCTVNVNGEPCSYRCWISEWFVPTSPVWKTKPLHMLAIRAYDKALAFASGAGISDMPNEREIQAEEVPALVERPTISVQRQDFTDMEPVLKESIKLVDDKKKEQERPLHK